MFVIHPKLKKVKHKKYTYAAARRSVGEQEGADTETSKTAAAPMSVH